MFKSYVRGDYYCGSGLGRDVTLGLNNNVNNLADGTDEGTGVLVQGRSGPFVMIFHTDNTPGAVVRQNTNLINNGNLNNLAAQVSNLRIVLLHIHLDTGF